MENSPALANFLRFAPVVVKKEKKLKINDFGHIGCINRLENSFATKKLFN